MTTPGLEAQLDPLGHERERIAEVKAQARDLKLFDVSFAFASEFDPANYEDGRLLSPLPDGTAHATLVRELRRISTLANRIHWAGPVGDQGDRDPDRVRLRNTEDPSSDNYTNVADLRAPKAEELVGFTVKAGAVGAARQAAHLRAYLRQIERDATAARRQKRREERDALEARAVLDAGKVQRLSLEMRRNVKAARRHSRALADAEAHRRFLSDAAKLASMYERAATAAKELGREPPAPPDALQLALDDTD